MMPIGMVVAASLFATPVVDAFAAKSFMLQERRIETWRRIQAGESCVESACKNRPVILNSMIEEIKSLTRMCKDGTDLNKVEDQLRMINIKMASVVYELRILPKAERDLCAAQEASKELFRQPIPPERRILVNTTPPARR